MDDSKLSQEYFDLYDALNRARHAIYSAREIELREYGTSPEQTFILVKIRQLKSEATQTKLASVAFRKPNTISITVKRMIKQGLIKKNKKKGQKGLVFLSLTEKGEEVLEKTLNRETINNIMSSIPAKRRQQLRSGLELLFSAAVNELAKLNNKSFLENIYLS